MRHMSAIFIRSLLFVSLLIAVLPHTVIAGNPLLCRSALP